MVYDTNMETTMRHCREYYNSSQTSIFAFGYHDLTHVQMQSK